MIYPLPNVPAAGDAFTAAQGCDHTMATCKIQFSQSVEFPGLPYVRRPRS